VWLRERVNYSIRDSSFYMSLWESDRYCCFLFLLFFFEIAKANKILDLLLQFDSNDLLLLS